MDGALCIILEPRGVDFSELFNDVGITALAFVVIVFIFPQDYLVFKVKEHKNAYF